MKQIERKYFIQLLRKNGYEYIRSSGSHSIYKNNNNRIVSVPKRLKSVVALRLIKEHNLYE